MLHVTHVSTPTSHDQLRGEVCGGRGVGGDAGVGAAVLGRQAEEEDVAREHVVLDLADICEVINVVVFLDTLLLHTCTSGPGANTLPSLRHWMSMGMSPEEMVQDTWDLQPIGGEHGSSANHSSPVALRQVPVEGEGRDLGRLDGGEQHVSGGGVALAVGHVARVQAAVTRPHLLDQQRAVSEGSGPRPPQPRVPPPPLHPGHVSHVYPVLSRVTCASPGDRVAGHGTAQQRVTPRHSGYVNLELKNPNSKER